MVYIAIILLCSSPSALSCEMKGKPESFYALDACLSEVSGVQQYFLSQGMYAVGNCLAVTLGEPV
tara:strand:+ start:1983 stop:2177 length:195 start_codon:yes stop_codon:yes gene_type:complete